MDDFALIAICTGGAILVLLLLVGLFYPGSGAEVVDWKPARSPELEADLDATDLEQMLEEQNRRRRARGEPELTEEDVELRVLQDQMLLDRMRRRMAGMPGER